MKLLNTKVMTLTIVITLGLGVAWYFSRQQKNNISSLKVAVTSAEQVSAPFTEPVLPPKTVAEYQQNPRKTLAMAKAFYASKDLRAFAEMAKNHPDEGGITYAIDATELCVQVKNILDIKPEVQADSIAYGKRVSALNDLRYRCQGFSANEISAEGLGKLYRASKERKDILVDHKNSFIGTLDHGGEERAIPADQRIQFLNELAQLQDPGSMDTYGREISKYTDKEGNLGFWINGSPYFSETQVALVNNAWDWVPCAMDMDCGANSITLEMYCAEAGKCFDNISDYYKKGIYADNPKGYEELVYVRDKIVDAIRYRNFGALLKPQ